MDEPAAADVETALRHESTPSRISAMNLAEAVDVLTRIFGSPLDEVLASMALLESSGLQVVEVDRSIGVYAGELHGRHYDRSSSPLSMSDCVALATATSFGEPLATSDEPLAKAASAESVATILLPDSSGRRPILDTRVDGPIFDSRQPDLAERVDEALEGFGEH
jgi:uncharacterized protein with PIN domain